MLFHFILWAVSLMTFLCIDPSSSCDPNCADKPKFNTFSLVVKYGDPTSVNCSACQKPKLETPEGHYDVVNTTLSWKVDNLTEWNPNIMCYYNIGGKQCSTTLSVTVYQPPENVSFSLANHTGPMFEGNQYSLQCDVQNVAPVEKLNVTFYRGDKALAHFQSNKAGHKPESDVFTLSINTSKEEDGAHYWCEARLLLGPEGPQPPPVVKSEKLTATVYYGPQLKMPANPEVIQITEGDFLNLSCLAVGNPSPSFSWTLPSDVSPSSNVSVLTINSVNIEHKGQYVCYISNSVRTVTVNFTVDVRSSELTPTTLPPTTTAKPTTSSAATTTTTTTTSMTTATTTAKTTSKSKNRADSMAVHRFIMTFMFLFSVLV
ncbi:intercellular adhesion molecule 2-like [Brachyistius frenatus]|uniref:intercellular adhesion molecule 2-like n=1 Tax=Brachyistius frenatus TaxID=100188 RepID=UPI0037E8F3C4